MPSLGESEAEAYRQRFRLHVATSSPRLVAAPALPQPHGKQSHEREDNRAPRQSRLRPGGAAESDGPSGSTTESGGPAGGAALPDDDLDRSIGEYFSRHPSDGPLPATLERTVPAPPTPPAVSGLTPGTGGDPAAGGGFAPDAPADPVTPGGRAELQQALEEAGWLESALGSAPTSVSDAIARLKDALLNAAALRRAIEATTRPAKAAAEPYRQSRPAPPSGKPKAAKPASTAKPPRPAAARPSDDSGLGSAGSGSGRGRMAAEPAAPRPVAPEVVRTGRAKPQPSPPPGPPPDDDDVIGRLVSMPKAGARAGARGLGPRRSSEPVGLRAKPVPGSGRRRRRSSGKRPELEAVAEPEVDLVAAARRAMTLGQRALRRQRSAKDVSGRKG